MPLARVANQKRGFDLFTKAGHPWPGVGVEASKFEAWRDG